VIDSRLRRLTLQLRDEYGVSLKIGRCCRSIGLLAMTANANNGPQAISKNDDNDEA
jgi:hypothetical protein